MVAGIFRAFSLGVFVLGVVLCATRNAQAGGGSDGPRQPQSVASASAKQGSAVLHIQVNVMPVVAPRQQPARAVAGPVTFDLQNHQRTTTTVSEAAMPTRDMNAPEMLEQSKARLYTTTIVPD